MHRAVFPQAPGRPAMGAGGMSGWSPRGVLRCCRGTVSPAGSGPALLREPCEGCDRHSPAQGKVGDHRWGSCFSSTGNGDDGSCEVNGRRYRDGEIFQPHSMALQFSLLTLGTHLASPLPSYVTLGKSLNCSLLHFLNLKMGKTIDLPPRVL